MADNAPAPKMSKKRFFEMAGERRRFHDMHTEGEREKKKLDAKLIPVLRSWKTRSISGMGWKVTMITQSYTEYFPEKAKKILPKSVYKAITKEVIDPDKLAQALSDGLITDKQVAKISKLHDKSPYLSVNPDSGSAE